MYGQVFWIKHPKRETSPKGHQTEPGEGEMLGWALDEHGQLCAIVETKMGRFPAIPLAYVRRNKPDDEPAQQ